MEILVLKKYCRSRLRGSLIRDLHLYQTGKLRVNAENGDTQDYWVDLHMGPDAELSEYTADGLLCDIQDDPDIAVSKY